MEVKTSPWHLGTRYCRRILANLLVPCMFHVFHGERCIALRPLHQFSTPASKIIKDRNFSTLSTLYSVPNESKFLDQVEASVARVLQKYDNDPNINILDLPPADREALGVARILIKRLQAMARNKDCRRCWLQQKHCVCKQCKPLEGFAAESPTASILPKINRLFLLMHHKEIALHVDTAKLILAAFPDTCRLVVGGLSGEYQESMNEMEEAMSSGRCIVLFPAEDAVTFDVVESRDLEKPLLGWDLIVIDGTWAQARKFHSRYVKEGTEHVQLSDAAVRTLELAGEREGHQLRRHPTRWREVSTLEATRLLLGDMMSFDSRERPWDALAFYQQIGDAAARKQLGPPRQQDRK